MEPTGSPSSARNAPTWTTDALHLLTLSAFAVAQPIFDLFGRYATFFVAHRSAPGDVLALTAIVLLAPTLVVLLMRAIVSAFSKDAGRLVHLTSIGLLAALVIAPILRRVLTLDVVPTALVLGVFGILAATAYARVAGLRRFMTWAGLAVPVFVGLFLIAGPVRSVVFPRPAAMAPTATGSANAKHPVAMVILDELSLAQLVRPNGEINETRFPNFARLAERSNWYANATTSALRTDQAVPALLTGSRPTRRDVPSSFVYPNNLFSLLAPSHEMHVKELVTQLCPVDACAPDAADSSGSFSSLVADTGIVYLHLVTPPDAAKRWLPPLGDRWAGFTGAGRTTAGGDAGGDPVRGWLRSALAENRTRDEVAVFRDWMDGISAAGRRPTMSYAHVQIPHPPWRYLPSGHFYPSGGNVPGYKNFRWGPDPYLATEGLQRSFLQVGLADRLVGELMDDLDERDEWDDALIVVTSDHGATWLADGTRRELEGANEGAMLWVPLFIKLPGQREGHTDRSNAELVDVVPTIADALDIEVPFDTDGRSLLGEKRSSSKLVFDGSRIREMPGEIDHLYEVARSYEALFGPGGGRDDLFGFGEHRELLGRRVSDLDMSDRRSKLAIDLGAGTAPYEDVDLSADALPAFLRGRVRSGSVGVEYLVALNGVVAGAGQTYREEGETNIAVFLSERLFRRGRNALALYEIDDDDRLREIRIGEVGEL